MKKLRWQLIIIFLAGLVVGVLLLSEQPTPEMAAATPEPEKGGIYTEAVVGVLKRLNPLLDLGNPADRDVDKLLFGRLLNFDSRGLPQPDLAESWGVSKDGTIYNVSLRNGVRWHDGKPLTAADVIFTIDLMRKGGTYIPKDLQDFWAEVETQTFGETTIQFKLPEPFAPFLDYLHFGVVPRHIFENLDSLEAVAGSSANLRPVGSGPYRFVRVIVEDGKVAGVELAVNAGYYGKKPFIEQFIIRYYPDSTAALKAYRAGVVQGISQVNAEVLTEVLTDPNLSLYSSRRPEQAIILLNHKSPTASFLKEPNIRRALLLAINRPGLISRVLNGQGIQADGPIFPGTWAFYDGLERLPFDPEKAKTLLKDAGFLPGADKNAPRKKGDQTLALELLYPDDPAMKMVAEAVQKDWAAVGVEVKITAVPYASLVAKNLDERNYQAALVMLNFSRTPDPDPYPFWDQAQATGGQNYTQWDNRMASEFLEAARSSTDQADRTRLYRNFQVLFTQEMPALPLYYPVYNYAVDSQVQGIRVGPLFDTSDRYFNVTEWFLVAKKRGAPPAPTLTPGK